MNHVAQRAALAVLGIATCALLALAVGLDVDESAHARYGNALRDMQGLQAALDREVARSRLGLVSHYDGLVRAWDRLLANAEILSRTPGFLDEAGATRVKRQLDRYRVLLEEKEALVEQYKTEQAVLRNSLHAFLHGTSHLAESLGASPELETAQAAIARTEHDVLALVATPSAAMEERIHCQLAALVGDPTEEADCTALVAAVPAEQTAALHLVRRHADVVVQRQRSVGSLVGRIMAVPTSARAHEVVVAYDEAHEAAARAARGRWLAFFVLLLVTVGAVAAFVIGRLSSSAVALRATTDRLEEALDALKRERDHEIELAALKSRFVSMTSHEFRTPLAVILSSAELLEAYGERWPTEKRQTHLGRVQTAAKDMSKMLDGVLLIGRAEAGMLELNPQPIDLGAVVDALVEEIRSVVGADRAIEYKKETPTGAVLLDEKLLRHVLGNLLSNAFKYSPPESVVHFDVKCTSTEARFEVRDEGVGIPLEEQPRLFEAFHRCSNAGTVPGHGLGLAIVKKSLDVHGGTIDVESKEGEGTRFQVRVPFAQGEAA